mmetsp:Transcript_7970/g.16001  ORF Transcript_7970/g.16001 Transcript_7970/m.16001 type:complete len:227 (-) Transcript_7970:535-1215(-)
MAKVHMRNPARTKVATDNLAYVTFFFFFLLSSFPFFTRKKKRLLDWHRWQPGMFPGAGGIRSMAPWPAMLGPNGLASTGSNLTPAMPVSTRRMAVGPTRSCGSQDTSDKQASKDGNDVDAASDAPWDPPRKEDANCDPAVHKRARWEEPSGEDTRRPLPDGDQDSQDRDRRSRDERRVARSRAQGRFDRRDHDPRGAGDRTREVRSDHKHRRDRRRDRDRDRNYRR